MERVELNLVDEISKDILEFEHDNSPDSPRTYSEGNLSRGYGMNKYPWKILKGKNMGNYKFVRYNTKKNKQLFVSLNYKKEIELAKRRCNKEKEKKHNVIDYPSDYKMLGRGGFGRVFYGFYYFKRNGKYETKEVALKIFVPKNFNSIRMTTKTKTDVKSILNDKIYQSTFEEISHLRNLSMSEEEGSENIVKMLDFGILRIKEHSFLVMITEFCNQGSLVGQFVSSKNTGLFQAKGKNEQKKILNKIKFVLNDFIKGYNLFHKAGIRHLDIKPENILIHREENSKQILKLADFGLAQKKNNLSFEDSGKNLHSAKIKDVAGIGTKGYYAPEVRMGVFNKEDPVSLDKIDMFSVGMTILYFCYGYHYCLCYKKAKNIDEFYKLFEKKGIDDYTKTKLGKIDKVLLDLVEKLLKFDAKDRMGFEELKKHEFVNSGIDHLKGVVFDETVGEYFNFALSNLLVERISGKFNKKFEELKNIYEELGYLRETVYDLEKILCLASLKKLRYIMMTLKDRTYFLSSKKEEKKSDHNNDLDEKSNSMIKDYSIYQLMLKYQFPYSFGKKSENQKLKDNDKELKKILKDIEEEIEMIYKVIYATPSKMINCLSNRDRVEKNNPHIELNKCIEYYLEYFLNQEILQIPFREETDNSEMMESSEDDNSWYNENYVNKCSSLVQAIILASMNVSSVQLFSEINSKNVNFLDQEEKLLKTVGLKKEKLNKIETEYLVSVFENEKKLNKFDLKKVKVIEKTIKKYYNLNFDFIGWVGYIKENKAKNFFNNYPKLAEEIVIQLEGNKLKLKQNSRKEAEYTGKKLKRMIKEMKKRLETDFLDII